MTNKPPPVMQDVVCSGCGMPIRDGFCGLNCTGQFDGVTVQCAIPADARETLAGEDLAVAMLAACEATIRHLWDIAARFDAKECTLIRDEIHRLNAITLSAIRDLATLPAEDRAVKAPQAQEINPACSRCGGPHPFDTTVPSVRWNAVIRKHGLPEYLCLPCIIKAFALFGESFTAELIGVVFEGGVPIEVRIGNEIAQDAVAISEENTTLRAQLFALTQAIEALRGGINQLIQESSTSPLEEPSYYVPMRLLDKLEVAILKAWESGHV